MELNKIYQDVNEEDEIINDRKIILNTTPELFIVKIRRALELRYQAGQIIRKEKLSLEETRTAERFIENMNNIIRKILGV
jgi:3-deoxy-D-arabino-heptulosonate 7-phosphate (DAHP) synthase class II